MFDSMLVALLQGPNPRAAAELMKMDGIVDTLVRLVSTEYVPLRFLRLNRIVQEFHFLSMMNLCFPSFYDYAVQRHRFTFM